MMEDKIQVFRFTHDAQAVRTVDRDGEIWFVAKDVCDILGIQNPTDAVANLDEDEKNTVVISDGIQGNKDNSLGITEGIPGNKDNSLTISKGISGNPSRVIISEAGLYKLIFRSRKPAAKAFSRWVTHEVLPQIRRTGQYSTGRSLTKEERKRQLEKKREADIQAIRSQIIANVLKHRNCTLEKAYGKTIGANDISLWREVLSGLLKDGILDIRVTPTTAFYRMSRRRKH